LDAGKLALFALVCVKSAEADVDNRLSLLNKTIECVIFIINKFIIIVCAYAVDAWRNAADKLD